jgi:hypothetical protein
MDLGPSDTPPAVQLFENFPAFYGTWRIITMFTRPSIILYPEADQSSPYYSILPLWDSS